MKTILAYGVAHLSILVGSTYTLVGRKLSFYTVISKITNTNFLHLMHTTFWMYIVCLGAYFFINECIGDIQDRELVLLSDNLYMYLIDSLLVLTIFSKDISHPNLIFFVLVVGLKCIVWILNTRVENEQEPLYLWHSSYMFILTLLVSSTFLIIGSLRFSIMALFALETGLIAVSHFKNMLVSILKSSDDDSANPMLQFYIDIGHLVSVLGMYTVFVLITTMKYKIPLNVFRSAVSVVEKLVNKIRVFVKYVKLCKDLEKCEDVKSDSPCPICHDEMDRGKLLRCNHVFHLECLKKWCEKQYFCPICRVDILLVPKEVVFFNEDEIVSGVPVRLDD